MSVHIVGERHDVAKIGHLRFWAERGLVHVEDSRDNSYESIPVKTALERLKGINDFSPGIDGTEDGATRKWVYQTREEIQDFIDEMLKVIKKAKDQGEPSDPRASRALRGQRPTTVVTPTTVDASIFD